MNKLNIMPRKLIEKNTRLREKNYVPGVLIGEQRENEFVKMRKTDLDQALSRDGEVYTVQRGDKEIFVKVSEVQRDPVHHKPIHFSLEKMTKGETSEVEIPISFRGEPEGVKSGGVFVILKDTIRVAGKPRKIPKQIEVDSSKLEVGDKLTINDLANKKDIEINENNLEVIAICKPPIVEKTSQDHNTLTTKDI